MWKQKVDLNAENWLTEVGDRKAEELCDNEYNSAS